MTDSKFEQLINDYPIIFQKSGEIDFAIGDGWYTIVDTLLHLLTQDYQRASSRLKYALENPDAKMGETVAELEGSLKNAYDSLPTIAQVKEKFGTLRFYVDGGTPEMDYYIRFAESLSGSTCEVCGSPGQTRSGGWVKVLCDDHHKLRETATFVGSLT